MDGQVDGNTNEVSARIGQGPIYAAKSSKPSVDEQATAVLRAIQERNLARKQNKHREKAYKANLFQCGDRTKNVQPINV